MITYDSVYEFASTCLSLRVFVRMPKSLFIQQIEQYLYMLVANM